MLYNSDYEHDACGIGAVVQIDGQKKYSTVDNALKIVEKLQHRAGVDSTGKVGDGVGILVQISHSFFSKIAKQDSIDLGKEGEYAVGMFFFAQDKHAQQMADFENVLVQENLQLLGWRKVAINEAILSGSAKDSMPYIMQCFVKKPCATECGLPFERKLYQARKQFEKTSDAYVVSFSSKTIVYKGLLLVKQLRDFYYDLQDEDYKSAIAMVHSRFSTNTFPSWERSHPNRMLLHNGEINTIRGNVMKMSDRENVFSQVMDMDSKKVFPIINENGSDSARFDNAIEFLYMNGMSLPKAMMITIPEPWKHAHYMQEEKKAFYNYYASMIEPWDGPAAILFSDGDIMGAILDRNGLRPSRYYVTTDNQLILSSEIGVLDIDEEKIAKKSRLEPGKMLLVDTIQKKIITDEEIKNAISSSAPYGEWVNQNIAHLSDLKIPNKKVDMFDQVYRDQLYKAFGYTYEDIKNVIIPMAKTGVEATQSMGIDIPLAVLSKTYQPMFNYFKQRFAQVTNPPIDSLREEIVTSTTIYLGKQGNLLKECGENCAVLEVENPILTGVDLIKIKAQKTKTINAQTVSIIYGKDTTLEEALDNVFNQVDEAIKNGGNIIILSDKGVSSTKMAIPAILAVGAVSQHLKELKKTTEVAIIIESAEPRTVHHFATLLGCGAKAVNPYLVHQCIAELIDRKILDKDYHTAINDYNNAIIHGVVKIGAKMGISTVQSYQSAQIFEAVGISSEVCKKYFSDITSRIGGVGLKEIEEGIAFHHTKAFDPNTNPAIDSIGYSKLRTGDDKEEHLYNPQTIVALQQATRNGDYNRFKEYSQMIDSQLSPHTLRGLMEINFDNCTPIDIEKVESVEEIVKRFKTGAMSYGSISKEAHECMAIAMNRLKGKSNSGEVGENASRYGTEKCSAIKQVASGRFGVTSQYLLSGQEIQIKMAQGAKPGEGGHLPGSKVYPWIAKERYATPGVDLISPPPHHDIYSIEDLAQLIYDLKNANEKARISVKLVSVAGVGTIAAGVAKAGAQVILISGFDGGTGAAPQTSIQDAGLPWELGLAEAHETLLLNNLRKKVIVETDGKLMTGRDVAIACMLGAEEFGFATAPLVTMGCMMMRVCNLDTCPFGIATQNEKLRARFTGKPEYIINFMTFIAQELREIMAQLGIASIDELVGKKEYIRVAKDKRATNSDLIKLDKILHKCQVEESFIEKQPFDFQLETTIDKTTLIPQFSQAIKENKPCTTSVNITCTDRTFGTLLGSKISEKYANTLCDDEYIVNVKGGAGQSFGAFIPKGLTLNLEGDANDYVGKGLSGGKIIVKKPSKAKYIASENIIIGNVAFYGATSGEAFINGVAGERFCVRNSGAKVVVEGCGDHGLEYMTGGTCVVLGKVGKNFAAGMSGGIGYIYDKDCTLYKNLNGQLIQMTYVSEDSDKAIVKEMIEKHYANTNSVIAQQILENFEQEVGKFKKIIPNKFKKIHDLIAMYLAQGNSQEDAELKAFQDSLKG